MPGHFRTDLAIFENVPSDLKNSQAAHMLRFLPPPSNAFLKTKPQKQGPGVRGQGMRSATAQTIAFYLASFLKKLTILSDGCSYYYEVKL